MKKKSKGGLTLPDFNTSYKAKVIMKVWCWYKDRQIDKLNRIAGPYIDGQLFGKGEKSILWRKESFLQMVLEDHF